MLPAQDKMPIRGLGNLIALPMQTQALKKGNSAFIDENWNVISNQWNAMVNIRKNPKLFVEAKIQEWTPNGLFGILSSDIQKDVEKNLTLEILNPWEKKEEKLILKDDITGKLNIVLANQIFIESKNVKARALNLLRRLGAFSNPEFYKTQRLGFSTNKISRIVQCGYDIEDYVCLPRGCEEKLLNLLRESNIEFQITDNKQEGKIIKVEFNGNLFPEQKIAADEMLKYNYGVLGAATGFGKTVIGSYIVSKCKVNTLILVHNREIMKNWIEDINQFLNIDEPFPIYETKKGKQE